MRKSFSNVISIVLVICMLTVMLTPLTAFAGTTATTGEPTYAFRQTFSDPTINTSGSTANVVAAKGFLLGNSSSITYTLENDTLKLLTSNSSSSGPFVDVRFNHDGIRQDFTQDFILSFWIKPDTNSLTIGGSGWAWTDKTANATVSKVFSIENGYYYISGTKYENAHLDANKWSLVEIAFNYDETATSGDGKQGATTSYTFMFNGNVIKTVDASVLLHNIDNFRILRYANSPFELDDLTVAFGNKSLIDTPRTGLPSEEDPDTPKDDIYIYREEFGKGFINDRNMVSAIAAAGGFWGNHQNGSEYNLEGGSLNYTKRSSSDFIDLRYYIAGNTVDMAKDLTFSLWIKPTTSSFSASLALGENGGSSDDSIIKIANGKLKISGTDYNALEANQWYHIEVKCDYDATATATNGKAGAFTSFTISLNGTKVATTTATSGKVMHELNTYRLFRYANAPFSIDDLTIASGLVSTYSARSQAPVATRGETVYVEDFSKDINTNSSVSAIVGAKGLYGNHANGTTYNVEGGSLNYTDKRYRDTLNLEFWHDGAKLDLSEDFVLSYKIKSTANTSYRFYWTDSAVGDEEHSFRHWSNRIRICDELKTGGITNPKVFTEPGEWALMELFFHYDENAVSEDGKQGAFTFYSVYVNGEYLQTTKTFFDFNKIDDFTLFSHSEDNYSIDDITIAYGNVSLGGEGFDGGWDEKDYFFDNTDVPTDYDYSLCIVGDTQVLSAWKKDSYNAIYDWIVENAEAKKMLAVLGLGDVTSNDTDGEWQTASAAINLLQNVVPFTVVRGNHDGDAMLNKYLNNEAYKSQFGGFYDENNVNTFWMPLTAGNDKYIVIGLDYGPTDDEVAWAQNVIASNPDYKIIITTHAYMDGNGIVLGDSSFGTSTEAYTNSGKEIWEKLGRKYANVEMILCGHMEGDFISVRQDKGDNGNTVTQMYINPQWVDDALANGAGNVTMFYFNEGSSTIYVETYSTVEKQHFMEENQFSIDLNAVVEDDNQGGNQGGNEGDNPGDNEGTDPEIKIPEIIYSNDFSSADSMNTTNNGESINAANGMWNKFELGTEYNLNGGTFNYITRDGDKYFELRYYYDGNYKDLKQDFVISFWMKPTSSNATFRFDFKQNSPALSDTKVFAIVNNFYRMNNVVNNDVVLTVNEWSLVEIVAHYDAAKGGTYAYTFMLNGKVVGSVTALQVFEEIDTITLFRNLSGTFSIDNLMIATGNQSLINTLNPYCSISEGKHTGGNATCTEQAKCSVCNQPYGDLGNHTADKFDCTYTCTVCGETVTADCSNPISFDGVYLNLNQNINVVFTVKVHSCVDNPYMVFTFRGKEYTVTKYTVREDGTLGFTFEKVMPYYMCEEIVATLYGTKDTQTVSVTQNGFSVKSYCDRAVELNSDNAEFVALASDLLVYGAKAQAYAGYKTNALATDGVEWLAPTAFVVPDTDFEFSGEANDAYTWAGGGLNLTNEMNMYISFTAESVDGLSVTFTINGREYTYDVSGYTPDADGKYKVYFYGVNAYEFDDVVTVNFIVDEDVVGNTLSYSVDSYINYMYNNADEALAELVKAISGYGKSASAYKN